MPYARAEYFIFSSSTNQRPCVRLDEGPEYFVYYEWMAEEDWGVGIWLLHIARSDRDTSRRHKIDDSSL